MGRLFLIAIALFAAPCIGATDIGESNADAKGASAPAGIHRIVPPGQRLEADDSPEEAQRYFLRKRLAPGMTDYPVDLLLQARQDALQLPLYSTPTGGFVAAQEGSLAATSLGWTSLGPGNVGGRTRAFRFVPGSTTTIFAAGVAGGVWKSTDKGSSWTAMGDAMANMAVTALLIDPSNTNVLYAGTGEGYFNIDRVQGAGIFKSTDGGSTWNQLSSTSTSDFAFVNDLTFKPGNSAIIYAATGTGLFQSTNSGVSWTKVIDASNAHGCMKVVYRSDVDTAVASCGTFSPTVVSTGIWRSANASAAASAWTHVVGPSGSGATQTLAHMGRISLAIAPSSQGVIYALIACRATTSSDCGTSSEFNDGLLAVMQSTDGGATWTAKKTNTFTHTVNSNLLLTNPVIARCSICTNACGAGQSDVLNNQGWYDNIIAVDPLDSTKVWVGGIDLWRSDDSGANWGVASYWWFTPGTDIQYAHADQHGIVFDPGFNGSSNAIMYATNDGGLFKTSNARATVGTNSTANNTNSVCGGSNLSAISFGNLNNGYGVTQYYHGTVYPSGTQYFAGAQDNGTTRGSDGSPNAWTSILGGDGGWTAVDKNTSGSSTVLYAENTGISISKSSNNGGSFSCATSGIVDCNTGAANDCGQFINPFQMDPNNTQRLFTSGTKLWRTSNAAGTWTQASAAIPGSTCPNGEEFTNYAIAPGNSDLLIAGTDNGQICRLTSATSSTSSTALQNCTQPAGAGAYVSEIAFDPNNTTTVYATISTFGAGHIWKSINSGQTWTNISGTGANALPDSPTHSVAVSPNSANTIYVGTEIGVFVTTDGGINWARENTGFANVITDHLVFNSSIANGLQLYAFTHGRGVFRAPIFSSAVTSTTTLTSSPNPSVFGQSVTLTATVTGSAGTATGGVNFFDGASVIASNVALNGSGVATFSTSTLSVATHSLSAVYSGSGAYLTSTGNATQTVNKANTTVAIGSDNPDASVVGQTVTVAASATATFPGAGTPTGSITVSGTNTTGCTITLPATSCNLTFSASGAQTISATYNGDTHFNTSSTAAPTAHTVNKANTTLTISDAPNASVFGQAVTLTATLAASSPGAGTPTGTVTVTAANSAGCIITLPATTCPLTFTATGGKTVNASYGGDGNFNGSSATAITQTVNKANTTIAINSDSPDPSVVGQAVTVNASVTAVSPGAGTPTGSITVSGSNSNGTCTITLPATSCNLNFTAAGVQLITAIYNGDGNFNTSNTTGSTSHTVNKAATTLAIVDSPDPTLAGENVSITYTLTVTAPGAGTPTGTITVTGTQTSGCSIVLPATQCTLSFDASGAQTIDASYGGDANFTSSNATEIGHTVTPTSDLSISKTDFSTIAVTGFPVTYTIVVTNAGPDTATGAVVTDAPVGLTGVTWTCTPTPPAVCPNASGATAISETVTLAVGQTLTYQLTGTVSGAVGATLTNSAQIAAPASTPDGNLANNIATDVDTIVSDEIFKDGFDPH